MTAISDAFEVEREETVGFETMSESVPATQSPSPSTSRRPISGSDASVVLTSLPLLTSPSVDVQTDAYVMGVAVLEMRVSVAIFVLVTGPPVDAVDVVTGESVEGKRLVTGISETDADFCVGTDAVVCGTDVVTVGTGVVDVGTAVVDVGTTVVVVGTAVVVVGTAVVVLTFPLINAQTSV